MMTNTPIDASGFEGVLNRLLNLTDQAWQAHADNRPFEYKRVERDFESLLADMLKVEVSVGSNRMTFDHFANIVSALSHANMLAKRTDSYAAFAKIVGAVEPITNKAKALDTAKR